MKAPESLLGISIALFFCNTYALDVEVERQITSNTLEWPELHLLMKNDEDIDVLFSLYVDPELVCRKDGEEFIHIFEPSNFWPEAADHQLTKGSIPAHGWNHRTFRLGSDMNLRQHLPCRATVDLSMYGDAQEVKREFVFELPNKLVRREIETPEYGTLVAGTLVEERFGSLYLRVLLENTLQSVIMVRELRREIACPHESEPLAHWDLDTQVRQGESGPVFIPPQSWGVLLDSVIVDDDRAYGSCVARIELGGNGRQGSRWVEVPLHPETKERPLFNHRPPPSEPPADGP